jgi:SAM-dependent methyltransferase
MNWVFKAVVQKIISYLPYKEKVNYFFQKNITKGVALTQQHFTWKIEQAQNHLNAYNGHSKRPLSQAEVLELGTGWYPIIPISFYLCGCNNFTSVDIYRWMNAANFYQAIEVFMEWQQHGRLEEYLPQLQKERWQALTELKQSEKTFEQLCQAIGFKPLQLDARNTPFKKKSFDFICSNNTFEHIPETTLKSILKEFKRVLKPDGIMGHFIDMSDHFAHADTSITIYNFLRYSKTQWHLIDNRIQPQNRLRYPDYLAMYQQLDLPIINTEVVKGKEDALKKVPLHASYKSYTAKDLAISHCYITSGNA